MLENKKAVIFDLDGTIADSMWVWVEIDREFFRSRKIPQPPTLEKEIEGMSFSETSEYFVKRFSLPDTVEELKAYWNARAIYHYSHTVSLKPGFAEFLKQIREQGLKTGIATSNSRELVDAFVDAQGFRAEIDVITVGCDVARGKPSPDVYLYTAKQLHVAPRDCLVFEDVEAGVLAGKRAGMSVCAVEDPYSADSMDEIRRLADAVIPDFTFFQAYERI